MTPKTVAAGVLLFALLGFRAAPAQAPASSPQDLLVEFIQQHDDGVKRLRQAYLPRLEAEKQRQMLAGNLNGANALADLITRFASGAPDDVIDLTGHTPEVANILKEHTLKEKAAITTLAQLYIARLDTLKTQFLRSGDLEAANAAERARADLVSLTRPTAKDPDKAAEITIEAYIDGNTELHLTKDGLYWTTHGNVAKPGLHNNANHPTYINGAAWWPKWLLPEPRGADTSDVFPLPNGAPKLTFEALSVSSERNGPNEPGRTPLKSLARGSEFIVEISDPDGGARWHKFVVKPRKR